MRGTIILISLIVIWILVQKVILPRVKGKETQGGKDKPDGTDAG